MQPGDKRLLHLTLPVDAKFWFAFVNQNGVWPWREGDKILIPLEKQSRTDKPVLMSNNLATVGNDDLAVRCTHSGTPVLVGLKPMMTAVRAAFDYRDFGARPPISTPTAPVGAKVRWVSRLQRGGALDESESLTLFADYGMPVLPHRIVESASAAQDAAREIGFPVVLKTAMPGILHKTERGGVHLDLPDETAVRAAWSDLAKRLGPRMIVARMIPKGVEIALGMVRDPQFGPLVTVGAGGVLIELLSDRRAALAPFGPAAARRLLDGLSLRRLLDAMASLLVDLHRAGVYWGDCSLANTLFRRDGDRIQAYLVDAETSEIHPSLSDGQRSFDLEILVENVGFGLADLGAMQGREDAFEDAVAAAESVRDRYRALWDELHDEPELSPFDRHAIRARIRRLNDLGFAVDELSLEPTNGGDKVRLRVAVASRRFHAHELERLTGLVALEGQARLLLNDLREHQAWLERTRGAAVPVEEGADVWLRDVLQPSLSILVPAVGPTRDPLQAYCDVLEQKWLLSEAARRDVGLDVALRAYLALGAPAPEDATADSSIALDIDWTSGFDSPEDPAG
jgi:hypothetical protein